VAERGIISSKGTSRFMSLWSFLPKGKPSGAGCSLIWDARIPYSEPALCPSGRFCAVTLIGPSGLKVRVIGVYAPASHAPGKAAEIDLLRRVLSELSYCRRTGAKPIVLGDFNEVPELDSVFNPNRTNSYPKEQSLLRYMKESGMVDAFRARHPNVHGPTLHLTKGQPSRIDSIWLPKSWDRAAFEASVSLPRVIFPGSDHSLVVMSIGFRRALGAPSFEARPGGTRVSPSSLDWFFFFYFFFININCHSRGTLTPPEGDL
jgi:hypothetical protein